MRWPTPWAGPDGAEITNTAPRSATTPATACGSHDQRSTTAVLGSIASARPRQVASFDGGPSKAHFAASRTSRAKLPEPVGEQSLFVVGQRREHAVNVAEAVPQHRQPPSVEPTCAAQPCGHATRDLVIEEGQVNGRHVLRSPAHRKLSSHMLFEETIDGALALSAHTLRRHLGHDPRSSGAGSVNCR